MEICWFIFMFSYTLTFDVLPILSQISYILCLLKALKSSYWKLKWKWSKLFSKKSHADLTDSGIFLAWLIKEQIHSNFIYEFNYHSWNRTGKSYGLKLYHCLTFLFNSSWRHDRLWKCSSNIDSLLSQKLELSNEALG